MLKVPPKLGDTKKCIEEEFKMDAVCLRFCWAYRTSMLSEVLERFGDFQRGGQVIVAVKCAEDLVQLVTECTVLLGMTDRQL